MLKNFILKIGDWGLGIGDWAQSPIPNPQSPKQQKLPKFQKQIKVINFNIIKVLINLLI